MRIAHVVDYFHTDVGYQEYYLALTQARAGHEVMVITSKHRHHALGEEGSDAKVGQKLLDDAGVDVHRLDAVQLGHDRALLRKLKDTLRSFRPDAVHCHHSFAPTTVRCAALARRLGFGLLVDNHIQEAIAPGASTPAGRAYYTEFRTSFGRYIRRRVDDWVTNGPYEKDFLLARMGLADGDVALVPLGFDPSIFAFDPQRRADERQRRAWRDDVVVAVTGKLHAGKQVELIASACERDRDEHPVRLVLAGTIDEDYLSQVRAAAPHLVEGGRFDVWPLLTRHDLAELYLAADVVAFARLPSISIYEAAGTGAVVAVGRDEFSDWLAGLAPGIRAVDPTALDITALATEATDDRAARARAATAAFSWETVSAEFVRRYEGLRCAS
jgi:glycosyltransferase involved in cell wall biosynthesis